jgi:hypothetical protein
MKRLLVNQLENAGCVMPPSVSSSFDDVLNDCVIGSSFDYGPLEPAVAKFLRGQADRIRRQCGTSIIQIGKALREAKRHLSHGAFGAWVKCEVGIPVRTAQAYMRVANWASGKSAAVAHLTPSALYILSATGIPDDFVDEILRRTEIGERITPSAMRDYLKAYHLTKRQERSRIELSARRDARSDDIYRFGTSLDEVADVVAEFVDILVRGLSADDLARVRGIVTKAGALSDPQFAQRLEQAFERDERIAWR